MLISDVKCKKKPDINDRLFIDCFLMVVTYYSYFYKYKFVFIINYYY